MRDDGRVIPIPELLLFFFAFKILPAVRRHSKLGEMDVIYSRFFTSLSQAAFRISGLPADRIFSHVDQHADAICFELSDILLNRFAFVSNGEYALHMRIEYWATICFAIAILHTFLGSRIAALGHHAPEGSVRENFFHLVGEVEIVFGLWAAVFLFGYAITSGSATAIAFAEGLNFNEPLFVFAIMAIAATAPILRLAEKGILSASRILPFAKDQNILISCLVLGPLMGSLITEPAAMTVTALVLKKTFFDRRPSNRFLYACLAVLFVNVSIGGTLTHFAAPPVLMVANTWNWDTSFMLTQFGWKAAIAVIVNALVLSLFLKSELQGSIHPKEAETPIPVWIIAIHLVFLGAVVAFAHHPVIFIGFFLFFAGFSAVTREYQTPLQIRESLLVAFFLGGLVVLGSMQSWWLEPLMKGMSDTQIFFAATGLTALTDNAALTYLGSQIQGLSDSFKYFLVAGAVTGGGLTVIANAPNPAGYSILQSSFGENGIRADQLLLYALPPTAVALLMFGLF